MTKPIAWGVMLWVAVTAAVAVAPAHGQDVAVQTLDVFVQRCAACHGAAVEKPKGKFGFIDDLRRVAADRDLVKPGDPDGSDLWQVIDFGDMPPKNSKHGMLTQVEKDTIRQWIAQGAKVPADLPKPAAAANAEPANDAAASGVFSIGRFVAFAGRFHPMVVHFPIALVLAALVAELLRQRAAARWCLTLGALGAIAATALGWALWWNTSTIGERETYMSLHQWVGSAMAVWVALTWWLQSAGEQRRKFYYGALVIAAAGIGIVGHWGGLLAWGLDYYRW